MEYTFSIIIAALSVMVTFLLGWQFYSILSLNRHVTKRVNKIVDVKINDIEVRVCALVNNNASTLLLTTARLYERLDKRDVAAIYYIHSSNLAFASNDHKLVFDVATEFKRYIGNEVDVEVPQEVYNSFTSDYNQYKGFNHPISDQDIELKAGNIKILGDIHKLLIFTKEQLT